MAADGLPTWSKGREAQSALSRQIRPSKNRDVPASVARRGSHRDNDAEVVAAELEFLVKEELLNFAMRPDRAAGD